MHVITSTRALPNLHLECPRSSQICIGQSPPHVSFQVDRIQV